MTLRSILNPASFATLVLAAGATAPEASAQDYVMFEVERLSPLPGDPTDLGAQLLAHNEAYHSEAPYTASVFYMLTGEYSGQYQWAMGPITFSQIGDRPADPGHASDRSSKVSAHSEFHGTEYWVQVDDLTYTPPNVSSASRPISVVRRFEVADDDLFRKVQAQVMEVVASAGRPFPRTMYQRRFARADRWGWAAITSYESFSDLDQGSFDFQEAFREHFGDAAWATFQAESSEAILNRDDVIRQLVTGN